MISFDLLKMQKYLNKGKLNLPVIFLYSGKEVQMVVPSTNEAIHSNNTNNTEGNGSKPSYSEECLEEKTVVLLPDSPKTALVSLQKTNKTTTDLEKSSQETRISRFVLLYYPKHLIN